MQTALENITENFVKKHFGNFWSNCVFYCSRPMFSAAPCIVQYTLGYCSCSGIPERSACWQQLIRHCRLPESIVLLFLLEQHIVTFSKHALGLGQVCHWITCMFLVGCICSAQIH